MAHRIQNILKTQSKSLIGIRSLSSTGNKNDKITGK